MSAEKNHSLHTAGERPANEPQTHMSPRMRLTMEEARILQECNRESFYYRSLPLAVAAITATQIAVNRGLLKAHPRWGSSLKLFGAGLVGWFIGKISYRSACEDKFLHLQNSPLADMIRKKRGLTSETFKDSSPSDAITLIADDAPTYSADDDYSSSSRSLNLDTDKNVFYSGLDDRPGGSEYDTEPEEKPPRFTTTYDDLRRKNREEYELRQSKLYQPPISSPQVQPPPPTSRGWRSTDDKPSARPSTYPENSSGMQNAYGDRWDK